jgi:hypothetical protein
VQALERRRGAAQNHRHLGLAPPHDGEVACVIAKALLLLEGEVVLVHDEEARASERCEHRRPVPMITATLPVFATTRPPGAPARKLECITATGTPSRRRKRCTIWEVSPIREQHQRLAALFDAA